MSGNKVIIIGAGVTGLSAGCYLQMNGYDTEIFELWKLPGGVCTAWQRKGYIFDGCIHWLVGSSPANGFHKVWKELHAVQGREFIEFDEFRRVELKNGRTVVIYTNIDKLENELLKLAPEDEKRIRHLTDSVRKLSKADLFLDKPMELFNIIDFFKQGLPKLPFLQVFGKWGKLSVNEYIEGFANKDIREALKMTFGVSDDFPAAAIVMMLTVMNARSAGYPIGGSLEFAKAIEKWYLELGGRVNYNSRVKKIIVENGKAAGIILQNGEEHRADTVISAADGHCTIFEMLEGKYIDEKLRNHYQNHPLFPSTIQVSLGIADDFKGIPHSISYHLQKPINTGGRELIDELTVRLYNFDPTLAPEGKTAAVLLIGTDFDFWERLKNEDPEKYKQEKSRIAYDVISALEDRFGGISSKVEVIDVATPLTYVDCTNNWRGSWEGWMPTIKSMGRSLSKTLPGLSGFYMIGQWVDIGGGLPPAGLAGRNIAQIMCKRDGKKFVAAE